MFGVFVVLIYFLFHFTSLLFFSMIQEVVYYFLSRTLAKKRFSAASMFEKKQRNNPFVWQGGKEWINWFLYITLAIHLIPGSKAPLLVHMPHLHLRADFIMISCLLAHIQLVNLFALDQRKFPRGCMFLFPSFAIEKVKAPIRKIVCLWVWIRVNSCVIELWSFHQFSLVRRSTS